MSFVILCLVRWPPRDYKTEADKLAAANRGTCLSPTVPTTDSRVWWKCANPEHPAWESYFFSVRPSAKKKGAWCRLCGIENDRHSLDHVRKVLDAKQIVLCEESYTSSDKPLKVECRVCGNKWQARFADLKLDHGCRKCATIRNTAKRRFDWAFVRRFLADKKITLLSTTYRNAAEKLECKCDVCGWLWHPAFANIKNSGHGCPRCGWERTNAPRRFTQDFVRDFMKARSIELLSAYTGSMKIIQCRCEICGHRWPTTFGNIRGGAGCASCAGNLKKTLSDFEALAHKYGGRILKMGKGTEDNSKWQCRRAHAFDRSYSSVRSCDNFCPVCSASLAERICGEVLKQLFEKPFKKVKIRDLRGVGGGYLEFDFYNKELKIALEHNGSQHYRAIRPWGGDKQLVKTRRHDELRREYCKQHGILLIEIRELGDKTKVADLAPEIQRQCARAGIVTRDVSVSHESFTAMSLKTREELKYDGMKARATALGFELLTPTYLGVNAHHSFRCGAGHAFLKSFKGLSKSKHCPVCLNLKLLKPVLFSDGRMFESLKGAARVLGSQGGNIKRVAARGGMSCGMHCVLITRQQYEEFDKHPKVLAEFCRRHFKPLDRAETTSGGQNQQPRLQV